jgi:hypothetical protein
MRGRRLEVTTQMAEVYPASPVTSGIANPPFGDGGLGLGVFAVDLDPDLLGRTRP